MLNRRHIRIKVMQSIYVMHQQHSDQLDKEEKFLFQSIENTQDLYLLLLSALVETKKKEELYIAIASKKHLATKEERNPSLKFVHNRVLMALSSSAHASRLSLHGNFLISNILNISQPPFSRIIL